LSSWTTSMHQMLTGSRQEVNGHVSKGIWLANCMPPHQRFERFSGDSWRVQILFKFVCGHIRTKVVQCVEQIVSRRTLKSFPNEQNYLCQSTRSKTHRRWGLRGCVCFRVIAGLVVWYPLLSEDSACCINPFLRPLLWLEIWQLVFRMENWQGILVSNEQNSQ